MWLAGATVPTWVALGVCLETKDSGEPYLNLTSLSLYMGVVIVLAAVAYAIHRALFRVPAAVARQRAVADALLVGVVTTPGLLFVVFVAVSIHDCSFGTGC